MQSIEIVDSVSGNPVILSDYLDLLSLRSVQAGELVAYPDTDPLTTARNVVDSRGYVYLGASFPTSGQLTNANPTLAGIAPNAQLDGTISVPEGSMWISIALTSLQPQGFSYRIYDKQRQMDIFYGEFATNFMHGEWACDRLSETPVDSSNNSMLPLDARGYRNYTGQLFIPSAYVMVGAGIFNISITNLSPNQNICQMLLNFAVPGSYTGVMVQAKAVK